MKRRPAKASLNLGGRRKGYGWEPQTDKYIKASGKFWQAFVANLVGGECAPDRGPDFDVWCKPAKAGIEVKVGSSKDGIKIRENQLDSHLRLCSGFPCENYWYACVRYRNYGQRTGPDPKPGRLFQDLVRVESDLPLFFQSHAAAMFFLDIAIVDAIRQKKGARVVLWRKNGSCPSVKIPWPFFERFSHEPVAGLQALGLDPAGFKVDSRQIRIRFEQREFELQFFAVLKLMTPRAWRAWVKALKVW